MKLIIAIARMNATSTSLADALLQNGSDIHETRQHRRLLCARATSLCLIGVVEDDDVARVMGIIRRRLPGLPKSLSICRAKLPRQRLRTLGTFPAASDPR